MRIAICDDNISDCRALEQMVSALQPESEIECFTDGDGLLQAMRAGKTFTCLFLDILMPDINGMKLATAIRRAFPDETIHLVFISISKDYALEAFGKNAIHYLVKPIQSEDVAEALRRIPLRTAYRPGLTVKTGRTRRSVFLDEIAVCESHRHQVHITLKSGEKIVCGQTTLESLSRQLNEDFLLLSRGIIVNFNYIAAMEQRSCTLRDGRKVLLSRGNLKQIQEAYDDYAFHRLSGR